MPKIKLEEQATRSFYCPIKKQMGKALLNCPACPHFPCSALRVQDIEFLRKYCKSYEWLERIKKTKMVIIEKTDGTFEKNENFNPDKAAEKDLKNIKAVYVPTKIYTKQVKLVPIAKKRKVKNVKESG